MHLDKNFNIFNLQRAHQRKEDVNKNFTSIVDYALKNRPDLFLISGDVFDRILPSNATRVFLIQKIKLLHDASIPVYLIGGNHDVPKISESHPLAIDALSSAGLATVFSRSDIFEKREIQIKKKKVNIIGKSYMSRIESSNPLRGTQIPLDGDYNILILHGSLQGLDIASTIPEMAGKNPFTPVDISKGVDYLALGHYHNYFQRVYRDCTIVNAGSIEKLSWAEIDDPKGFVWSEITESDTSAEFIHLETRTMEKVEFTLSKTTEYKPNLTQHLMTQLTGLTGPNKMLKLVLKGDLSLNHYDQLKIGEILNQSRDLFFHLTVDRSSLKIDEYGRIFIEKVESPLAAFTRRLDSLIADADKNEKKRAILEQIKRLGETYLEASS